MPQLFTDYEIDMAIQQALTENEPVQKVLKMHGNEILCDKETAEIIYSIAEDAHLTCSTEDSGNLVAFSFNSLVSTELAYYAAKVRY